MRTHLIHRPARDIFALLGGARFSPIAFDPSRSDVLARRVSFPRGTVFGERVNGPPLDEAENFFKCDRWFDSRDLAWVENQEGTLPHPTMDQALEWRRLQVLGDNRARAPLDRLEKEGRWVTHFIERLARVIRNIGPDNNPWTALDPIRHGRATTA
jgi:hypothetical protein